MCAAHDAWNCSGDKCSHSRRHSATAAADRLMPLNPSRLLRRTHAEQKIVCRARGRPGSLWEQTQRPPPRQEVADNMSDDVMQDSFAGQSDSMFQDAPASSSGSGGGSSALPELGDGLQTGDAG